jgi:uncharacterized protein YvpB
MKKDKMSFSLHDGGIYMEEYELEKQTYQVAVYSKKTAIELSQDIRIASYSALRNNKSIKAGYRDGEGFGLIVFYDNAGAMQMVIQVMGGSDPETMTSQWMNYLGLILPSEEQKKADKTLTQKLVSVALLPLEILMKIWGNDWEKLMEKEVLTPQEIAEARKEIEKIEDEEERGEAYLKLQEKVSPRNQRNNSHQSIADVMCNLTSEAMCFEYLGISCPDDTLQFEDYLENIRINNGYGERTTPAARDSIAAYLDVYYSYETMGGTFSQKKEILKNYVLLKLKSGCSVMMSVWPICKGHLVRVINVTDEGIIVDDPYGKVTDFISRENCNGGGYDLNSKTSESSKGGHNLWKWVDLNNITVKYIESYCIN